MKTFRKPYKDVMEPERFERHARMWISAVNSTDDLSFHKDVANYIRNFIHDVGQRTTGLVSEEAMKLKASQRCKEHFHSRLAVGLAIVDKIRRGIYKDDPRSIRRIYLTIFSACRVHNTTSEENRRLAVIQNDPATKDLNWRRQYKLAGVRLVDTNSVYVIDQTKYIGWPVADMCSMLGVSAYKFNKYYVNRILV